MKRVDFFIAGNSKSGTTALYKFLAQHPRICMSEPKEPNFFATDFCHDQDVGAFRCRSEEEYHSLFDDPTEKKIWGEASACYLYSREAARATHRYNPAARILILLREPVSFLRSYHLQLLENVASEGEVEKDFERALGLEQRRKQGRDVPRHCLVPQMLFYRDRIRYAEQLERFLHVFDTSQMKVMIYEDFKEDNAGVVRAVMDFIGADREAPIEYGIHNKGQALRSKGMQRLVYNLSHGEAGLGPLKTAVKFMVPRKVRKSMTRSAYEKLAFKPVQEIDPAFVRQLKKEFQPEVVKLSTLLGRDLVQRWGYDSV